MHRIKQEKTTFYLFNFKNKKKPTLHMDWDYLTALLGYVISLTKNVLLGWNRLLFKA
jgi:hypothetical protein